MQAEATADPLLGATLAERYHVVRCIGRGGMGVVYEAVHVALGKRIAIKLLLDKYADDHEAVARFQREALTATQIGDDHIIDVLDVGTTPDGKSFVVLEFLDGMDLGKLLAASGPMPASRAVHIIQQILRGLGAAHAKGIVHRDMKPDNVFIVPHSETTDFVKILDFGISKIMAAQDAKVRLTATGTVVGTPIYMAPEQALGNAVDHRADLYSVGIMLYELLAGRPPFVAESYLALVTQHLQAVPPDLGVTRPDLPRGLVNVIHRALSKEPEQRFRNAEEFARALPSPNSLRTSEGMAVTYGSGALPSMGTPDVRPVAAVMGPSTARSAAPARVRARRRWILGGVLAVAAIASAATAIVVATRSHGAATAGGKLKVETTPGGVKVYVDDEYVGSTPIELTDIGLGKHRVRLEHDGFVSMSTTTTVAADENASIIVAMTPDDHPGGGTAASTEPGAATGGGAGTGATVGAAGGSASAPQALTDPGKTDATGHHRTRPRSSDHGKAGSGAGSLEVPPNPYGDPGDDAPATTDPGKDPGKTDAGKPKPGSGTDHRTKPNPYDD